MTEELHPRITRHDFLSGSTIYYRQKNPETGKGRGYFKLARPDGSCSGPVPSISTLAKNDGSPDPSQLIAWRDRERNEGRDPNETFHEKGRIGDAAHAVLEQLAEGVTPPFQTGHEFAVISWWKTRRPEPIYTEQIVYDEVRGFAGRFDLMYGERVPTLLDLKTGSVRAPAFVQTNLYRLGCRASGLSVPERLLILDTREDGGWSEIEVPIRPEWAIAALDCYRAGQNMRKCLTVAKKSAVIGPPQRELAEAA